VLDHDERHRPERDAEEEQVGDQPRPEEMVAVEDEPDPAEHEADDPGDKGAGALDVDVGGRGVSQIRHQRGPSGCAGAWPCAGA
jgi:hypothetical protein